MKKIILLGSTGSIGRQTLEIVRKNPRDFEVVGLAAGENFQLLRKQIREFQPKFIATKTPEKFENEKILLLEKIAAEKCDLVVSAISGVAGLWPTLAALAAGRDVALANKECLVAVGSLVRRAAKKTGAKIFPIDSEHSGVWQLLDSVRKSEIRRVILTASGGALRDFPLAKLPHAKPADVLRHPTWAMGAKITVDCATMANKAFEIVEAAELFELPLDKIEAVIHPQSAVHALVETVDGSIFAQLSSPDMRLPISLALFEGMRKPTPVARLDLTKTPLEFRPIDRKRYPLFFEVLKAAKKGGLAPAVAAAADELANEKFLAGEIEFGEITKFVAREIRKASTEKVTLARAEKVFAKFLEK